MSYDATILADSPRLYLTAGTTDQSGHPHLTSAFGSPTTAILPNGELAYQFDGSSQYLSVSDADDLSVPLTGVLTVECWVKLDTLSQPHVSGSSTVDFINKGGWQAVPGANQYEYEFRAYPTLTPQRAAFKAYNLAGGTGHGFEDRQGFAAGQWMHLVGIINTASSTDYPNGYVKFYRDGVITGIATLSVDIGGLTLVTPGNGTAPIKIGAGPDLDSYLRGAVGKIAVYDYELTPLQVANHSNAMVGRAVEPWSAYDLAILGDDPSFYLTSSYRDETGNDHIVTQRNLPGTTRLPNGDAAFQFDGTNWVTVADADDLSVDPTTHALTIECWIQVDKKHQDHLIDDDYTNFLTKGGWYDPPGANQYEWNMRYYDIFSVEGRPQRLTAYAFNLSGGLGVGAYSEESIETYEWVHCVAVINATPKPGIDNVGYSYDLGSIKWYKDGALYGERALDNPDLSVVVPQNGTAPMMMGRDLDNTCAWQGSIAKVAIYPRELTSDQIVAHYNAMLPLPPASVTRGEKIVLDPGEVSENASFDITALVGPAGPDWGDAMIQQYLAEAGVEGQVPIDFTIPNRTITIPLVLVDSAGLPFHQARISLQQKVATLMEQGGWVKRHTSYGDVYAEVVNAQLKLGGSTAQAMQDVDTDAQLVLTTLPPWLGLEEDLGTYSGTGELDILLTDKLVEGNHPGRLRIMLTDASGNPQLGAIWAVRARNLVNPVSGVVDATNYIAYEAEDLTPAGAASVQVLSGASGPTNQVIKSNVPITDDEWNPNWQAIVSTRKASGENLTHVGTYRVWTRAYIEGGTAGLLSTTRLRFRAEVGDLRLGAANAPTEVLTYGDFYILDLGVVRLDRSPAAGLYHRWQGYVEAMNLNGTDDVSIDKLWIVPVQDGAGAVRALDPTVLYDGRYVTDAVLFADSKAELRSDGMWRLAPVTNAYGPIQRPQGPLPKLPASGMEGRPVEIFVKVSRGTLDERNPDAGFDAFQAEIRYQPSYLFVS